MICFKMHSGIAMTGASVQEQEQWLYGFPTSSSFAFENIQMPHEQGVELEAFHQFNDLLDDYKPFQLFDDQPVKEEHFEHYNYGHGSNKIEDEASCQLGSQVPVEGELIQWKPRKSGPFQSWSKRPRAAKTGHKGQYMLKKISEIYHQATEELKNSQELLGSAKCPQRAKEVASSHNHMIAERSRRKRESQHLETLRSCLPSIKKKDKVSVLQGSIDYIKQLMCQVRDLERQNKELEARVMFSEGGQPMVSTRSDEEVNKSSDSHQSGTPSMVTQEDGLIPIQLGLGTTGRQQQLHMLISMLNCIKDMGFEVCSLQWNPENSSKLDLALKSKMKGALSSSAQVQRALERRMFGDHAIT